MPRWLRAPRGLAAAGLGALLLASTGCVSGFVFTHVTEPLDVDFHATPVYGGRRGTSMKRLVIPYPVRMQFDWGSTGVADGMRKARMTRAYYADIETMSFMGVWTQRWIHIYGETAAAEKDDKELEAEPVLESEPDATGAEPSAADPASGASGGAEASP